MIECYLDDCFNGMKKIEDKKIDCVLTDPPYGINYQSGWTKKFDKIHNDKTVFDLDYFFNELNRITKVEMIFCRRHFGNAMLCACTFRRGLLGVLHFQAKQLLDCVFQ